jgi:hypothetical protein
MAENAGAMQRRRGPGRPFRAGQSGNPMGKPLGTRNRATRAAETLLDGEAEALTRKAVELALAGDTTALRLCLDRILPPRKSRPVTLDLPAVTDAAKVQTALTRIVTAASEGEITPDEAGALTVIIEAQRRAIETVELEARLRAIEERSR